MIDYINRLDNIFSKLIQNQLAYIDFDESGYYYRQDSMTTRLPELFFDIKKSNFLTPSDIQKNVKIINKLKSYEEFNLISMTPTNRGYYFQVFSPKGILVYSQEVKFFSLGKFGNWWAKKRFPELALKIKKF